MEAKAHLSYARISPRKVQIVCDLIRGKDVKTAAAILMQTPKAASELLLKLLNSAVANAENNHGMDVDKLYVSAVSADPTESTRELLTSPSWSARRIKAGGNLWDRKLIPMDCALA